VMLQIMVAVGMQLGLITRYEIVLQEKYACTTVSRYIALVKFRTHRLSAQTRSRFTVMGWRRDNSAKRAENRVGMWREQERGRDMREREGDWDRI